MLITQVVPFPEDNSLRVVRNYREALRRQERGAPPSFVSLEGYIAGRLTGEVLERSGPELTRAGFLETLTTIRNLDFGGFSLTYGPGDTQGSDRVFLTRIEGDGTLSRSPHCGNGMAEKKSEDRQDGVPDPEESPAAGETPAEVTEESEEPGGLSIVGALREALSGRKPLSADDVGRDREEAAEGPDSKDPVPAAEGGAASGSSSPDRGGWFRRKFALRRSLRVQIAAGLGRRSSSP